MIKLTLRHLRRDWRLNTAALLCLTLASALLASFSGYAAAIAARELTQSLDEVHPVERSLFVSGTRYTFDEELYGYLQEMLGELLRDRMVIRHATSPASQGQTMKGAGQSQTVTLLDVYSFDKLADYVRVVEGRLPAQVHLIEAEEQWRPPPIEAVIGARTAEQSGYAVGDRLVGKKGYHRLDIVGIVEPLDPHDDVWGEDMSGFEVAVDAADPQAGGVTVPLIVAPGSMKSSYPQTPIFWHEVSWRITLNHHLVSPGGAGALRSSLINFQTQFATEAAETDTGLVRILGDYAARLSRVRMTLFLLAAQTFIFVLYTLTLFTSSVAERSQAELATLSARGASGWQITRLFALKNLILALLAALFLGPGLAQGAMLLWSWSHGEMAAMALPPEAWLLSGAAAGFGWLALVLPVFRAARRGVIGRQQARAQPVQLSAVQERYLDLYLLAFSGLLYWQLGQAGSFVMSHLGDAQLADPLLLIGPSLLVIAIAMVSLRILAYPLRLVAWLARLLRGLVLPLGLGRLARDPLRPSRVVLLVSLTAGLMLFARTFGDSLAHSQEEMAYRLAGADLRVSFGQPADLPIDQLADLPGVEAASPVFRGIVQTEDGQSIRLLAVDPATFAQVARGPDSTIPGVMRVLRPEAGGSGTGDDVLPAVFSSSALPEGKSVGDQLFLNFAGRRLSFSVQATIDTFPTMSGSFVIVSLPDLEPLAGPGALDRFGSREGWLAVDPAQHERLATHPALQDAILDDARARLSALRSDALAQGTSTAVQLNAMTLVLFSATAFFLVHFFAAQARVAESGVLRAMGFSAGQLLTLLIAEGLLVLLLGLLAGIVVGLGLSRIMMPYLSQSLAGSLGGVTVERILVDWPAVARLYLLLTGVYGSALALLSSVLMLTRARRALWREDE